MLGYDDTQEDIKHYVWHHVGCTCISCLRLLGSLSPSILFANSLLIDNFARSESQRVLCALKFSEASLTRSHRYAKQNVRNYCRFSYLWKGWKRHKPVSTQPWMSKTGPITHSKLISDFRLMQWCLLGVGISTKSRPTLSDTVSWNGSSLGHFIIESVRFWEWAHLWVAETRLFRHFADLVSSLWRCHVAWSTRTQPYAP